jgi:hypothetical protein
MGWVSERHNLTGGSLNGNPKNNGSDRGPLRKIVRIIRGGAGWFSHDWVEMECGHEGRSTGGLRARCKQCKELAEK